MRARDAAVLRARAQARQLAVVRRATHVEIQAVCRAVHHATRFQGADHLDLLGHVRAGFRPNIWHEHVQTPQIGLEQGREVLGDGERGGVRARRGLLHFVRASSASEVRCPTSVMLTMCFTACPAAISVRRSKSANT